MEETSGFRKVSSSSFGGLALALRFPRVTLELVSKLLYLHFRDCKTKVSGDALQLMAEFLRIFVVAPGLLELPSCGLQSLQ
ncbi:centromere protein X isoform X6 [Meriones unguiculatus]|uniref:centromere protein X isoform X6 n=1 Tax=Meriones unguiculatus TaxID=10047 RepID=UPI000B4FC4AC|nr:centromere protein X isoform X6 [Meriones unguiculatus]